MGKINKTAKYLFGYLSVLSLMFAGALGAQDVTSNQAVNQVPISGYRQLAEVLADPDVGTASKQAHIYRLAELTKHLEGAQGVTARDLFQPILGILGPRYRKNKALRMTAVEALVSFARLKGSADLVPPLAKILADEENELLEVRKRAAFALGRFNNDAGLATDALVKVLKVEGNRGPKGNNISFVNEILESIGRLHNRKSHVPLTRFIDSSNFPTSTKRAAQKALENIRWE